MEEKRRGYDLPFSADPGTQIAFILIGLIGMAGVVWFAKSEGVSFLLVFTVLFLAIILNYAVQLLARLHIIPEGIAITLFGLTLRCVPAENIRVIVALRKHETKANPHDVMAVCANTVEELTELGNRHMPKLLQNEADRWYGQTASHYLYCRAVSVKGDLNLHKHILWLDWSPERLRLLREMYPEVQWLDGTEKKLFDTRLKQEEPVGEEH